MFLVTTKSDFDTETQLVMLTVVKPTREEVEANIGWSLGQGRDNYDMSRSYQAFRNEEFGSAIYIHEILEEGTILDLGGSQTLIDSKSETRKILDNYQIADEDMSPRTANELNQDSEENFEDSWQEE